MLPARVELYEVLQLLENDVGTTPTETVFPQPPSSNTEESMVNFPSTQPSTISISLPESDEESGGDEGEDDANDEARVDELDATQERENE
jgi:hypothetical protein